MTLKNYLNFLIAMTGQEFKARYKKAIFGFLWVILNPLLEMAIIGTVFSQFIDIPNYYLFLFAGLLPWQFFSLSVNKATPSFDHQRFLLKKAVFPKEAIPLSIIFANFINLLISIGLLIVYLLITQNDSLNLFSLAVGLVWLLALAIGLVLITAPITARYRDVNFFTQTGMVLIFYATPILYASHQLPKNLQNLLQLNPLTTPIELIRSSLIPQGINNALLIPNLLATIAIILCGLFIYQKIHKYLVDWL